MKLYAACFIGSAAAATSQRYGSLPIATEAPGLIPRYFIDKSYPLAKRQSNCGDNSHSCEEIGFGSECCDNDSYCYISNDNDPRCCQIGSNCVNDSPCQSTAYLCTQTATVSGTATAQRGCCNRKCPSNSQFLCEEALGGGCCPFDSECRQGGSCVKTLEPSRVPSLTPIVEGCTTRQYKCEDGFGCCDDDQICTDVSNTGYCAAGEPTQSNIEIIQEDNNELSDGAKAGIGVGVVVGAGIVIGLITWFCLRRRKERREATIAASASETQVQDEDRGMSEVVTASRPRANRGLTQDYFGPAPIAGPYTETAHSPTTSPGQGRGVPSRPQGPGDIAAAVELDSKSEITDMSRASPTHFLAPYLGSQVQESIDGRFELHGSDMAPPPRPRGDHSPTRSFISTPPITPRPDGSRPL